MSKRKTIIRERQSIAQATTVVEIGIVGTPNDITIMPITTIVVVLICKKARSLNLTNDLIRANTRHLGLRSAKRIVSSLLQSANRPRPGDGARG
jgi:hypothetical protein